MRHLSAINYQCQSVDATDVPTDLPVESMAMGGVRQYDLDAQSTNRKPPPRRGKLLFIANTKSSPEFATSECLNSCTSCTEYRRRHHHIWVIVTQGIFRSQGYLRSWIVVHRPVHLRWQNKRGSKAWKGNRWLIKPRMLRRTRKINDATQCLLNALCIRTRPKWHLYSMVGIYFSRIIVNINTSVNHGRKKQPLRTRYTAILKYTVGAS